MTPMTPGQISYYKNYQREETPKYIKDLKSELQIALKKNFDLKNQLEKIEELHESGVQNKVIEIGEKYA